MSEQTVTSADLKSTLGFEAMFAFGVVTVLLLSAEGLILFQQGDIGLLIHAFTVIILIAIIARFDGHIAFLSQALLLVPILRIFNLGIPPFTQNPLVFLGVIYIFILMSTWMIIRSQNLSVAALGLTVDDAIQSIPGAVIGIFLGLIQFTFSLEPLQYSPTIRNYILVTLTTGLLVGLAEELIFRGLVQRWATELVGRWPAIFVVSVLFGFMHSVWLAPMDIVFAGTVSILLGWIYASTRNMWLITSIHAMINITAFLLAPLYWGTLTDMISSFL